ncbi:MAG: PPOX class F420-dependent oxidoreductase [Chloroflexota bacterium]
MTTELSKHGRLFLEEIRFAVLATMDSDGSSQQTVMWYELQGDEIMMNTKRGRLKDRNMRRDSRISVCVADRYVWVTVSGTASLDDDQEIAQADIKRLSTRYHGPEKAERQARDQFSNEHRVTIRMPIERVVESLD